MCHCEKSEAVAVAGIVSPVPNSAFQFIDGMQIKVKDGVGRLLGRNWMITNDERP
jgi:hypothetical protein